MTILMIRARIPRTARPDNGQWTMGITIWTLDNEKPVMLIYSVH
jgi:hypothetical protein